MRLIRLNDVSRATGLRRSTIYKYMAEGAFPKAVALGGCRVAWVEQEIQDWISERVKARDSMEIKLTA
ncbi:AlpA family transcriptional regulator [Herbaspirillum sp. VT-16-41]|uniref:helix-turn-helix transcriptional regulator n=1 Tax=Herbaspirillum sp. VT-16-41 TaxID=1953765 RepID=UPI000981B83C|nr:AlpA family transcriptional regulator [Herbaspirillum sp. VT-16-41]ONN67932.1 transcriptional regulator [Herbaspirillum sp. VT-16-41]